MWLKLNDPARSPAHWLEIIRPGEFCVFILDADNRVPKDFEGREFRNGDAAVEVTPDFDTAVRFAERIVARHPELCCEIYGSEGKSGEPLRTVYEESVRGKYEGLPFAKRETAIGFGLMFIACLLIAYDALHDLRWMWGYIIGGKLFVIGGTFLVRGVAGIVEHRISRQ